MKQLNTHYYDGSLTKAYRDLVSRDQPLCTTFVQALNAIKADAQTRLAPGTLKRLNRVLKLLAQGGPNNYDQRNQIQVEDILSRTWQHVQHFDSDGRDVFYEQLCDILNGSCAQGRTTRIYQFYQMCPPNFTQS